MRNFGPPDRELFVSTAEMVWSHELTKVRTKHENNKSLFFLNTKY